MKELSLILHDTYANSVATAQAELNFYEIEAPDDEENWPVVFHYGDYYDELTIGWDIYVSDETSDILSIEYKGQKIGEFTDNMLFGEISGPALVDYISKAIEQMDNSQ